MDWIDDWNRHDFEAALTHYADSMELVFLLATQWLARPDGTIRNTADLPAYFAASLGPDSAMRFDLRAVLCGVGSYTIFYANHRGQGVAEIAFPDHAGLIAPTLLATSNVCRDLG
ncbi:MAG: hypothetical protein EXR05_08470 [Acetobacteraceae bacterium]|nr:hypothetical protein [Acetobacteraceae bacterium]MSP29352.1 hypothetical protein [Acetobacteraceae bacterium]